jgi:hypothetical protein
MLEIGLCGIKNCSTINLEAARKRKSLFFPIFAKDGGATKNCNSFFFSGDQKNGQTRKYRIILLSSKRMNE